MSGTVNIARSIWTDAAFKPQPFTEREAFMWMVMEASWKDREKRFGKICVQLSRGQLATSIRFMAEAWSWQKSTVDRFIKRLENRDMIGTDIGTGVSVITIRKYNEYQYEAAGGGTDENEKSGHKRDSSGTNYKKGLIPDEKPKKEDVGADAPVTSDKAFMPDGWVLSEEGWAYARKQNIPDEVIEDEARGFQAYWADRRDRDAKKSQRGWEQCWANRCRNIAGRYSRRGMAVKATAGGYGQGGSIASIVARRRASGAV